MASLFVRVKLYKVIVTLYERQKSLPFQDNISHPVINSQQAKLCLKSIKKGLTTLTKFEKVDQENTINKYPKYPKCPKSRKHTPLECDPFICRLQ